MTSYINKFDKNKITVFLMIKDIWKKHGKKLKNK